MNYHYFLIGKYPEMTTKTVYYLTPEGQERQWISSANKDYKVLEDHPDVLFYGIFILDNSEITDTVRLLLGERVDQYPIRSRLHLTLASSTQLKGHDSRLIYQGGYGQFRIRLHVTSICYSSKAILLLLDPKQTPVGRDCYIVYTDDNTAAEIKAALDHGTRIVTDFYLYGAIGAVDRYPEPMDLD